MPSNHVHRDRSSSSDRLPKGVQEITEKDFYLKNDEFRLWLKEEKNKYFTELSGDKARSYFRKFVKNWNKGKLSDKYYQHDGAHTSQETASASTSYRWAFASGDKVSDKDIRGAREAVKEATNGTMTLPSRPVHGPSLPGSNDRTGAGSDTQYEKELMEDRKRVEGIMSRKRAREEENDRLEDLVGPRAVGREKMQENKKARRENDRAFREKDAEPDIDADTLMGGDSFQARLAQRDAARKRFDEKRGGDREAREAATRERTSAIREKEKATMDMFKALAKERFG